jgi:hypothetical protein
VIGRQPDRHFYPRMDKNKNRLRIEVMEKMNHKEEWKHKEEKIGDLKHKNSQDCYHHISKD